MANYRTVNMQFWTDAKVADDFSRDEKYFFLYLLTNPHTNMAGCYEITVKQMAIETDLSKDEIAAALTSLEQKHGVVKYSHETKELLLLNWYKYSWTTSIKFRTALREEILSIKNAEYKKYVIAKFNAASDTVSIPYPKTENSGGYGSDIITKPNQTKPNITETETAATRVRAREATPLPADAFESEIQLEESEQLFDDVLKSFTSSGVFLAGSSMDELRGYFNYGMDPEVLAEAAKRAADAGIPTWKYTKGILKSWVKSKVFTIEDVRREDASHERKKAAAIAEKEKARGKPSHQQATSSSSAPLYDPGPDFTGCIAPGEDAANWKPKGCRLNGSENL